MHHCKEKFSFCRQIFLSSWVFAQKQKNALKPCFSNKLANGISIFFFRFFFLLQSVLFSGLFSLAVQKHQSSEFLRCPKVYQIISNAIQVCRSDTGFELFREIRIWQYFFPKKISSLPSRVFSQPLSLLFATWQACQHRQRSTKNKKIQFLLEKNTVRFAFLWKVQIRCQICTPVSHSRWSDKLSDSVKIDYFWCCSDAFFFPQSEPAVVHFFSHESNDSQEDPITVNNIQWQPTTSNNSEQHRMTANNIQ